LIKHKKILHGDKAELIEPVSKKGDKVAKLIKKSQTKITSLPIRVLTILFEHVSTPKTFLSLSRTCKVFRQVVAQEDLQKKTKIRFARVITEYFPNNTQIKCQYFVLPNLIKHGEYREFREDGGLYVRCYYKDGEKHGHFKQWHRNGNIHVHALYKNGQRHLQRAEWYKNGKLFLLCSYQDGVKVGEHTEWYRSGQLHLVQHYENGIEHGEYKRFYEEEGKLMTHCSYKNGLKDGEFTSYHANGKVCIHCFYHNDLKHGEFKRFYENGELDEHLIYTNGRPKTPSIFNFNWK